MSAHPKFQEEYCKLTEQGVIITSKDQFLPWLWIFIHHFLRIITFGKMNNFLTEFTTTIGNHIVFYDGWTPANAGVRSFVVLRHEGKHVDQYTKLGFGNPNFGILVMGFLYLFLGENGK